MYYLNLVLDKTSVFYKLMSNLDLNNDYGNTYNIGYVGILVKSTFCYSYERHFYNIVRP